MGRGHRRLLTVTALAALLVGGASLAWACTPQAALAVSSHSGPPGSQVRVDGYNFQRGPVEIRWNSIDGQHLAVAQGPSFSVTVTVPADATTGKVHHIYAHSAPYQRSQYFEVTAPERSGGDPDTGDDGGGSNEAHQSTDDGDPGATDDGSGTSQDTTGDTNTSGNTSGTTSGSTSGSTSGGTSGATSGGGSGTTSDSTAPDSSTSDSTAPDGSSSDADAATSPGADAAPADTTDPAAAAPATGQADAGPSVTGTQTNTDRADSVEQAPAGTDEPAEDRADQPVLAVPDPSARSATGDLWGGFATAEGPSLTPGLDEVGTVPATGADGGHLMVGLGLLGGALLVLIGGALTVAVGRRRVRAHA